MPRFIFGDIRVKDRTKYRKALDLLESLCADPLQEFPDWLDFLLGGLGAPSIYSNIIRFMDYDHRVGVVETRASVQSLMMAFNAISEHIRPCELVVVDAETLADLFHESVRYLFRFDRGELTVLFGENYIGYSRKSEEAPYGSKTAFVCP